MSERHYTDEEVEEINCTMAHGALQLIRELLDDGGIPRGTFADDQVRNLVALYNHRGNEIERLKRELSLSNNEE